MVGCDRPMGSTISHTHTSPPSAETSMLSRRRRTGSATTASSAASSDARSSDAVGVADGEVVTGEQVLVATGRRVDVAGLGLDAVGVAADVAAVPVDDNLRVTDGVWAVGDVTGKGAFTHVAIYQARIAAADILGRRHEPADYRAVPRVTFTDPRGRRRGADRGGPRRSRQFL